MESSMKPRNDQENKKMALKLGLGNGGGIGAVVLLGGALATAALASAFVARRSSGKNRRRRNRSPLHEQDEENKGKEFVFPDQSSQLHENPSEVRKDVEADNDGGLLVSNTQNSTQVEKPSVEEINEEKMKLDNDVISDESTITKEGFPLSDEKLSFEPQNMKREDDDIRIQLTKEVIIPNGISKESEETIEQVCVGEREASHDGGEIDENGHNEASTGTIREIQPREEENIVASYDQEKIEVAEVDDNRLEGVPSGEMEKGLAGFCSDIDGGEINVERCSVEAIDGTKVDLGATGLELSEDDICQNQESEEITIQPGLGCHVMEHENVNGDENESPFSTEIAEVVKENDAMAVSQEDGAGFIEDNKLVDEETDGMIEEKIFGEKEEVECLLHPSAESKQFGLAMVKEEVTSPEDIEVIKENGLSEEVAESLETMNQNEAVVQFVDGQSNDENAIAGNVENEAEEELIISPQNTEVMKEKVANEEVAEIPDMNQCESTVQFVAHQPNDKNAPGGNVENEVAEDLIISAENTEVTKEGVANEEIGEILEVNQDHTTVPYVIRQPNDENAPGGNAEDDVKEELVYSPENTEVSKKEANEEVSESPEVNQDETSAQFAIHHPKDENTIGRKVEDTNEYAPNEEVAESLEMNQDVTTFVENGVEKELIISPENTEVNKEEVPFVEIAEMPELNESNTILRSVICQSKDNQEITSGENEVMQEVISPEDTEVSNENKTLMQFGVIQPIDQEDCAMKSIPNEISQKELIISTGEIEVAKENDSDEDEVSESLEMNRETSIEEISENVDEAKDDLLMEMRGDEEEENSEDGDIKDLDAEIASSDEVENVSTETGDSSMESELDAVWPAESLEQTQEVKRIDQELVGKIQEDKAIKGGEYDDNQITGEDYSSFGKEKLEKSFMKKYTAGMYNQSDLTRRKMVLAILSIVSSLSCSWFFDLSFVKLSLIVFLTMAIVISGY